MGQGNDVGGREVGAGDVESFVHRRDARAQRIRSSHRRNTGSNRLPINTRFQDLTMTMSSACRWQKTRSPGLGEC